MANWSVLAALHISLCNGDTLEPHFTRGPEQTALCRTAKARASFSLFKPAASTATATVDSWEDRSLRSSPPWYLAVSAALSPEHTFRFEANSHMSDSGTPVATTAQLEPVNQVLTKCCSCKEKQFVPYNIY